MLSRLRIAAVFLLLLPYVLSAAQGIVDLIKSPGFPEAIQAKDLPADFQAVTLKTSGADVGSSMVELSMMSFMFNSRAGGDDHSELYDYTQASWTNGQMIKTDSGEFLVTYKLNMDSRFMTGPNPPAQLEGKLRLALIRKDTIVQISPRSDLTRERLAELFAPPAVAVRTTQSSKTAALSNMKQLALGMIMYQTDCDDLTPYVQDTKSAFAVIMPYLKNNTLTKSLNPGSRILLNMAVAGVEATKIEAPDKTILFYDEKPWPDGTRIVAFCDGHAKAVSEDDWRDVEKSLHLKLKHSGKPLPPNYWKQINPGGDLGGITLNRSGPKLTALSHL